MPKEGRHLMSLKCSDLANAIKQLTHSTKKLSAMSLKCLLMMLSTSSNAKRTIFSRVDSEKGRAREQMQVVATQPFVSVLASESTAKIDFQPDLMF